MKDRYWAPRKLARRRMLAEMAEDVVGNDSDDDVGEVDSVGNKVYFYSEVDRDNILTLNKSLREVDDIIVTNCKRWNVKELSPIYLHINSYGGSVFAGLSAVDYIRRTEAPIYTVVDGCAASAATLMSVVGDKRFINKHSYMLIHQLSAWQAGTFEHLKDENTNNNALMDMIRSIYLKHTKIPKDKLDEMLKHDLWFDAETCLKYGLVDEILE